VIAAMVGALKAGKTYVPLDPNYPEGRLSWMLEHAQAAALLTNDLNLIAAQRLASSGVHLINTHRLAAVDRDIDLPAPAPDRLASLPQPLASTAQPPRLMQNHPNPPPLPLLPSIR